MPLLRQLGRDDAAPATANGVSGGGANGGSATAPPWWGSSQPDGKETGPQALSSLQGHTVHTLPHRTLNVGNREFAKFEPIAAKRTKRNRSLCLLPVVSPLKCAHVQRCMLCKPLKSALALAVPPPPATHTCNRSRPPAHPPHHTHLRAASGRCGGCPSRQSGTSPSLRSSCRSTWCVRAGCSGTACAQRQHV